MAKTEHSRTPGARPLAATFPADPIPAGAPLADVPLADLRAAEPPESLDKVRDILFGGQMRAVEGRLQALEERLMHEHAQLRGDLGRQIAALEGEARRELQALGDQLAADRAKRVEELKALDGELRDALRGLERRHVRLEELGGAADAELRDSILEQSRATSLQIERLSQRVSADLGREVAGLRHDKADVAALAGLFSDMAGRLGSSLGNGAATARDGPRS